jgi:hypothetical protein
MSVTQWTATDPRPGDSVWLDTADRPGLAPRGAVRRVFTRAVLLVAALLLLPSGAGAATGELVKANCAVAATAANGTMVWFERNSANVYDAYIGNDRCEGSPMLPPHGGHRGPSDITSDGRFVILTTAVGWDRKLEWSGPGKGSGNAIQVYDRVTGTLKTLLRGGSWEQRGVIWPKLARNGTLLVWSQMLKSPLETNAPWGDWEIHVADVDLAAGTLTNERRWRDPAGGPAIYETYGMIPGTDRLIFQSTTRSPYTGWDFRAAQLFTLPLDFTEATAPTRISPKLEPNWSWEKPRDAFHEFVHFAPNDPNTLYTSIGANTLGGIDVYRYDLSSQDPATGLLGQPERVSYFGGDPNRGYWTTPVPGWPKPAYRNTTSLAWVGDGWNVAVCPDLYCTKTDAWRIRF